MGKMLGLPDRHGVEPHAGPTGGSYEFDQLQNHTFLDLAKAMKFVGVFTGIAGAIYGVVALFSVMHSHAIGTIVAAIQCVVYLVLGSYLVAAAANCRRIVDTQGQDIPNLMAGLDQLRRYFTLQMILIILALCALGAGMILFLVV